jgi:hypothetical protein
MSKFAASKVVVSVSSLESAKTGKSSGIAIYSWFKNGTDGESVCRLLDLETNTWCSEDLTSREAVRSIVAGGRTITPGMVRNITLADLEDEDEDGVDVLYEIVKYHNTRCSCEPCRVYDVRETEA